MFSVWNPWHGCKRVSTGCLNCYVYRIDKAFNKDSSIVEKTKAFDYPIKKDKYGEYKLSASESPVYACLSSDFFIQEADEWRNDIWKMIHTRSDIDFKIITKRIERFAECIPENWGDGYENVTIICTCENQKMTDKRLPIFLELPIKHREIIHEPMLERIDISEYLKSGKIEKVTCGGESGENARVCDYDWILNTRKQCIINNVSFVFKQTGENFIKDSRLYNIPRKSQLSQAEKADINFSVLKQPSGEYKISKQRQYMESEDYSTDNPFNSILLQLSKSPLHSDIILSRRDREYYKNNYNNIYRETEDIVKKYLLHIMSKDNGHIKEWGHPAYTAMKATGCCCRNCLYKWHNIPTNRRLTDNEVKYITDLMMEWMKRDMKYS